MRRAHVRWRARRRSVRIAAEKFGSALFVGFHQVPDWPESWSAMSFDTTSKVETPEGVPASPTVLRKLADCACDAGHVEGGLRVS